MSDNYSMTIDGAGVTTQATLPVHNPATGEPFAQAPLATREHLDQAVAAAQKAFPAWRAKPLAERQKLLLAAADALEPHAQALGQLFMQEQGRPLEGATQEIHQAIGWLRAVAQSDLPVEVTEESDTRRIEVHLEPLGVVAAIVPWNFPVLLAMWKVAPALLTGNTMVLKPSPFTPLVSLRIGEILRDVLPAGVYTVISGADELGPWMTAHPGFAKISFTGSTATGKRVMESAAKDLKRVTLELGGNDAAIVMPDVNVDEVAQQIFFGAFWNSAQICVATKRLYVHADIYDALRDRLHGIAQAIKVGDGSEPDSVLGPIQNEPQYRRVMNLLEDAKASGLKLLVGREVPQGRGYFVPVVIVDNPPEDSRVVAEEAFGPILPMVKFHDVEEVIARANNSPYGLAGAVWSSDVDAAVEIAKRLDTGTVWINQNLSLVPGTPFAGRKQSGLGVENGTAGLLEFTQPKALYIPKKPAA
jgi:acyl-CoA reductase-like NAD-dependent aldehyde dehydrogenase